MGLFDFDFLPGLVRRRVGPTQSGGAPGTAIYGGYVQSNEVEATLTGAERYRTYGQLLSNVSIIGAGTRYFLNLAAKGSWTFTPSEDDRDGRYAELLEACLVDDPDTSFSRIIRRAALFRFYGFSVQEWIARRRDDGVMTLRDVKPRPQRTITRWDVAEDGTVRGVVQSRPQDGAELYLPRTKLLYLVDDTLSDSPEGMGLFRHLVAPASRLQRYEQLEGFGFEGDLRGVPVARAPLGEQQVQVANGRMTPEVAVAQRSPLMSFLKGHVKNPQLGLLLDSETYKTTDDKQSPSNQRKWDIELLKAESQGLEEVDVAINRVTREIATVLGVENLLLGSDGSGSLALSRDKSHNFYLAVDGALGEIREQVERDLVSVIWKLNGWPEEMKPQVGTEAIQYRDVEQVTAALGDMARAGAVLQPDDPAIDEVRALLGLSPQPEEVAEDAELMREMQRTAAAAAVEGNLETTGEGSSPRGSAEGSVDDPEEDTPDRNGGED